MCIAKDMISQFSILLLLCLFSRISSADAEWATAEPSYRQVTVTGFSRARNSMPLATEVAGKVAQVFADVGEPVPKHGKVACLDDTFVKIDLAEQKNVIAQHQADVDYYQKQVARYRELVGKNHAAVSKLDEFTRNLENARHSAEAARLRRQRQQQKWQRHCLYAPPGWLLTERAVEPGQWLDVGNRVAGVANYAKLLVPLSLTVEEMRVLQSIRQRLSVSLPDYGVTVPAKVELIWPEFDEQTRKTRIDLLLENDLPLHRGGIRADLQLELPDPAGYFFIAEAALDRRFEEVWLRRKDGSEIGVEVLNTSENGRVRIHAPDIKAGEAFIIIRR